MGNSTINRQLDGIYFRVKRGDKWEDICFSDLTDEEMEDVLKTFDEPALRRMCKVLGKVLREIGDELDLFGGEQ